MILLKSLGTQDQATNIFTKEQESFKDEIEKMFGISYDKFQILLKLPMKWYPGNLQEIMKKCIFILHKLIVEPRDEENTSFHPVRI